MVFVFETITQTPKRKLIIGDVDEKVFHSNGLSCEFGSNSSAK